MKVDQQSDSSGWRLLKWIFGFGLLFGAVFVGLNLFRALSSDIIVDPENQWQFDGGGRFQIFNAAVSNRATIKSERLIHKMPGTKEFRTSRYRHGAWLDFEMESSNKVVSKGTLKMKTDGLILEVGASDRFGKKIIPQISYSDYWGYLQKARFYDSGAAYQPWDTKGAVMEYGLEVEDGNGGWIRMSGPFVMDEVDWRAFVVAPIFPRTSSELQLRVTRTGDAPMVIVVPNPSYGLAVSKWAETKRPWRETLKFGSVQVDRFRLVKHKRSGRNQVETRFKLTPNEGRLAEEYEVRRTTTSDETGNVQDSRRFNLLPNIPRVKTEGLVRPSVDYRWHESETILLAEGICLGDSEPTEFKINQIVNKYGISKITLRKRRTGPGETWQFKVEMDVSKWPRGASSKSVANPFEFGGILFFENEVVSTKRGQAGGGGSSTDGYWHDYSHELEWNGAIQEGQKVRLAIVPSDQSESFEFILPTSKLEGLTP